MTPKEIAVKATFLKLLRVASQLQRAKDPEARAKILAQLTPTERKLITFLQREGPYELLRRLLPLVGTFYRTNEGYLLFFRNGDYKLYDIEEKTFERYLIQLTDNVSGVRHEWLPRLQAWVRFEAAEVTTHFLAYNDSPDLNVIAINTFDGHLMRRKRGRKWERLPNGTESILFLTPPEFLTPWQPDFKHGGSGKDLDWLCSLGHFAADGQLSVEDQRDLLRAWILHHFAPAINPVHPIPLHEGVTGSGKSVLGESIGRWITGPQFEVMDLPSGDAAKAEESLKIALCKRPLVVIDNVDSPSLWLEDFICRVATGVRMSRRRLYTNTEEVHFTPRAGLIITSRDPHFRREDVARRLLPIRFELIPEEQRRSETDIRAELDARRAAIWADVLVELARVQDAWPSLKGTLKPSHSLTDFSVFGAVLVATHQVGDGDLAEWPALMQRLELAQGRFTTEEDPLADLLGAVLPSSGVLSQRPMRELFTSLRDQASESGLPWPYKNVGALTKALKNKRVALERALDARISLTNNHQGGEYRVEITKLPGDGGATALGGEGGEGGDDSATSLSATEGLSPEAG